MNAPSWERVEAIFSEAVELPPEARAAFLDRACGGDEALRTEVEGLLTVDVAEFALGVESEFLWDEEGSAGRAEGLRPGDHVGPYRIEAEVGRGGMGTVYRARRADGVFEKEVALKLVKRGMDTDEVLARFRRERQVLAGLDHAGIARLLDGGAADDGRPYLVMEFVEGEPITAYCEARRFPIGQRLSLFGQVCAAVQHAHRRLVVHRDLKPSNILVTEAEQGGAQVKLLDFGIARLLNPDIDEALTQPDVRRLTPAYAAPEQLRGETVTTAADVYALGVVLYQILTGQRPPDPLKPPSAVVESERLCRLLRGDLDVICLKTLREEPEARYPSVEALAEDLRRHRDGLPVQARPASAAYRVRKFVERHRVGVVATVLIVLSMLSGLGVALWQARTAALERDAARREAAKAEQVTDFLVRVFEVVDPRETGGDTLTAQEILDLGSVRIDAELVGQPEVQAELFYAIGRVYQSVGAYAQARDFLERSLATRRRLFGPEHPDVAISLNGLAEVLRLQGEYDAAEPLYREALAIQHRLYDGDHPDEATTLANLALLLHLSGRWEEAIPLNREALAMRRRLIGPEHVDLAGNLNNLAGLLHQKGGSEEAEPLYREALAMLRKLRGADHPDVAVTLTNLGAVLRRQGNLAAAEPLYREAIAIWRNTYGDEHPDLAVGINNLAALLRNRGDLEAAEPFYREALEINRRLHGEQHPSIAASLNNLGKFFYTKGEYETAEAHYRDAVRMWRELYGDDYPHLATGLNNLADALYAQGDLAAAEPLYRQALSLFRRTRSEGHPRIGVALTGLGRVLLDRQRDAEAEPLLRESLRILQAAKGDGDVQTAEAMSTLGACLVMLGRFEEAEPLLLTSYPVLKSLLGEQHTSTQRASKALGDVRAALG